MTFLFRSKGLLSPLNGMKTLRPSGLRGKIMSHLLLWKTPPTPSARVRLWSLLLTVVGTVGPPPGCKLTASGFSSSPGLAWFLHTVVSGPTIAGTPHRHSLWGQSKSQGQIQGDGSPPAGERPRHQAKRPEGRVQGRCRDGRHVRI